MPAPRFPLAPLPAPRRSRSVPGRPRAASLTLALCALLSAPIATRGAEIATGAPLVLDTFRVTTDRVHANDLEGVDTLETYALDDIEDTGAFSIDEFLSSLPPDTSGGVQLVLIDGRPTYIDPAKLPLGMIEAVEVSNEGSMPQHGAYATGRIINIRLKKDYRGQELGLRMSDTFSGGGGERTVRYTGAESHGKLRLFYGVSLEKNDALSASERSFSRDQDHTALGGRDLRLAWGSPAVLEASAGVLTGLLTPDGRPTPVGLVPSSDTGGTVSPQDFSAGVPDATGQTRAVGQRRFNTSAYQQLESASKGTSINFGGSYRLPARTELSVSGSFSERRGQSQSSPPVTPVSESTKVPAAYNPFGQEVKVGLVHTGFGPVRQLSRSRNAQLGARLSGRYAQSWSWSSGIGYRRSESKQAATDLDRDKFSEALRASDPARRFDPFGSAGSAEHNATLYPDLTVVRRNANMTENSRLDLSANGQVTDMPAGAATASLNADVSRHSQERESVNSLSTTSPRTQQQRTGFSASAVGTVPLAGKQRPLRAAQRLEVQLSAALSGQDDDSSGHDSDIGAVWVPLNGLLLRTKYGIHIENTPARIVANPTSLTRQTIIDPLRPDSPASEVQIVSQEEVASHSSRTERWIAGASLEVPHLEGLRVSVNYRVQLRHQLMQRQFDAQDVVDNESLFPGRVVRAEPTALESVAGMAGQIASVDVTPGGAGEGENQNLDMSIDYTMNNARFGRLRVNAFANHVISARQEIEPGKTFVSVQSNRLNPPEWTSGFTVTWSNQRWNVSSQTRHTSSGIADAPGTHGFTSTSLNLGVRIRGAKREADPRRGGGLRVGLGVSNLFAAKPPFADTISGYRLGSALGRSFSLTCTLAL